MAKKKDKCCSWIDKMKSMKVDEGCCNCGTGNGFFGRALFIIGVFMALNAMGIMTGVSVWIKLLIGIGFALMTFK